LIVPASGRNYTILCATGADAVEMLYEPESRTVLFSYDWS